MVGDVVEQASGFWAQMPCRQAGRSEGQEGSTSGYWERAVAGHSSYQDTLRAALQEGVMRSYLDGRDWAELGIPWREFLRYF